jgi:hypothetical protein
MHKTITIDFYSCNIFTCVCLALDNWAPCFIEQIKVFNIYVHICIQKKKKNHFDMGFVHNSIRFGLWKSFQYVQNSGKKSF